MPVPINSDANAPWWQEGAAAILVSVSLFFAALAKKVYAKRKEDARASLQSQIHAAIDKRFSENVSAQIDRALMDSELIQHLSRKILHLALRFDEDREAMREEIRELRRQVRSKRERGDL